MTPNPYRPGTPEWHQHEALISKYNALYRQIAGKTALGHLQPHVTSSQPEMVAVESFVGNFYGWRFFKIREGHLGAVMQTDIYKPGQKAVCGGYNGFNFAHRSGEGHAAPLKSCSCGYYAHHTLENLLTISGNYRGSGMVLGLVQASGRIIEHDTGFRAEYLTPVCLFFQPFTRPGLVRALRKEWGCKTKRWSWPQDVLKKSNYPNIRDQSNLLVPIPFRELDMDTAGPSTIEKR